MTATPRRRLLRTNFFKVIVNSEEMNTALEFTGAQTDEGLVLGSLKLMNKLVNKLKKSPTIALDLTEFKECFQKDPGTGSARR